MSHFQIETWLASQSQRAENALLHNLDSERSTPEQLHKAMRYAVLGGGKRIRPLLVFAASELRPKEILDQALVDTAAALRSKINANDVAVRSDLADTSSTLRILINSTTTGLIDTASAIRSTLATKVNYADTAAMLAPYASKFQPHRPRPATSIKSPLGLRNAF